MDLLILSLIALEIIQTKSEIERYTHLVDEHNALLLFCIRFNTPDIHIIATALSSADPSSQEAKDALMKLVNLRSEVSTTL